VIAILIVAVAGGGIAWGVTSSAERPQASPTSEPTRGSTRSPVPVIVPGRPGQSASVVPSDRIAAPDGSGYNAHDVRFVRMMIPHHRQAIEMATLAPARARNPQTRAIAERIVVAQGPEIAVLQSWLDARDLGEQGAEHDHGTMRGMVSPQAISALAGADGEAFDRMLVDLMSAHHRGAIDMCREVLKAGADERLQELATNIAAEQRIEIARMRESLGR
jgi:uncharacterized protein (DUF305 family)